MNQKNEILEWPEHVSRIPLIGTILVNNDERTIYSCLLNASKIFDAIIVVLDGSTDNSLSEIDKFVRRENARNIHIFDLTRHDPWTQIKENDDFVSYAKSQEKCYSLTKSLSQDGLWVSLNADAILDESAKNLIQNKVRDWSHPEINCQFFELESHYSQEKIEKKFVTVMWLKSLLFIGPESYKDSFSFYLRQHDKILMTSIDKNQKFEKIGIRIR